MGCPDRKMKCFLKIINNKKKIKKKKKKRRRRRGKKEKVLLNGCWGSSHPKTVIQRWCNQH
jgi:hypothetical protein